VRILGIDLGGSRTGLALSDPLGLTCSPLDVIEERDEEQLLLRIVAAAKEQEVGEMVVGLPRPLAGGTNRQLESALAFADRLGYRSGMPVSTWDERFTSKLAQKGRPRTVAQDAVAACYMLQSYLDSRPTTRGDA
jgi:putative holliday junction resolvase